MWEKKNFCHNYLTKLSGILLRLFSLLNCNLTLFGQISIQWFYPENKRKKKGKNKRKSKLWCQLAFGHLQTEFFKLAMIIEIIELVWMTLILFWMTVNFIRGYNCKRKQKLGCSFLTEWIDLDEMWYAATTYWCVEAHAKFFLCRQWSRDRTLFRWFFKNFY